ncbi:ABC transporter permease [Streptomyces sp. CBMA156]|uniref:ABC transporter permease n=1 Tax=Streptomyces sp. CBMA156 TaxID=1930280 RepID=UPI00166202D3|nr:ABC transporter permease [Streptomyces sp. CBMA156]MBD0672645.1 ABC transporter [Streptomyces sp. CBMA156]MBD0675939.1 ABC transporter [Streptomyces sp. CBMA156]
MLPRRRPGAAEVPLSRLKLRDLLGEALSGMVQRPGRSVLTLLGTVLGVGAFVAVLGLTSSATGQIGKRFSALQNTTVTLVGSGPDVVLGDGRHRAPMDFPDDADRRVDGLNGAVAAGVYWSAPLTDPKIATSPVPGPGSGTGLNVLALSPGGFDAIEARVSAGTVYNAFHGERGLRVAVLGSAAAGRLGISRLDAHPAVFVNGVGFTVIGIIDGSTRLPETALDIMVPTTTARTLWGNPQPGESGRARMVIRTRTGAAGLVASQAPTALRPEAPKSFEALAPPDPQTLRDSVSTDLTGLFLLLATICLVIGAVGIANTTLVAVLERTGEIGLRRALGARPRHIAAQFLTESTVLGTLGGLIGTAVGVAVVVLVALARDWTALLQPWTVLPAPLAGSLVGLLAGLYPALRAATVEPAEALRR